jgi:hypothetical protein
MPHKFFYSWQSERPKSVCREFIRGALEKISTTLNQSGIEERIEIDSDTQGVPGTPEIFSTILSKIEAASLFVADLTICAEGTANGVKRLYPNSNVMFEYGYALKAQGRSKLICIMNTFYGGNNPADLPFDLRHARAPIRFRLGPEANEAEKAKVFDELCNDVLGAARLILDNLPGEIELIPAINFDRPHFEDGDEITPEGDYPGQINPTFFGPSPGFIYLRGHPLKQVNLTVAQLIDLFRATAALSIADGAIGGSFGTNKWGRISYTLEGQNDKRTSYNYVQYFRSGEIEMVNGSYFRFIGDYPIHLDHVVDKTTVMLGIMKEWIEKTKIPNWLVEVGVIGVEHRRLTLQSFGNRGPLLHQNKIAVQKKVDKDSILLLAEEVRTTFLAEVGI